MSSLGSGAERNHQLPDGSWVCLRIENDSLQSKWTYFWLTFVTGEVRPAWYRVFPLGTPPPEWQPLDPAAAVDKQTGVEDDESDKDAEETMRENEGKIGAAKRLRPGQYVFQSKIRVGADDVELTSVEFQVTRGPFGAGWG
jgi:hypothetical protein